MPLRVDGKITAERETIPVGSGEVTAHHCTGHSPGSLVYTAKLGEQTVLFGQDIHGPLHPSLLSNRSQYLKSLKFLLSLEVDILCEGHFGVFRGRENVKHFIRQYFHIFIDYNMFSYTNIGKLSVVLETPIFARDSQSV